MSHREIKNHNSMKGFYMSDTSKEASNKNSEKRTETLTIRLSPGEVDGLRNAAKNEFEYPSSFLRRLVLRHLQAIRKARCA